MTKSLYSFAGLFMALQISVFAQDTGKTILETNITDTDDVLMTARPRELNAKTVGSPYIDNEFIPAQINSLKKTQLVRHNAAMNLMEIKKGEGDIMVLSKAVNYRIQLKDGSGKEYLNLPFLKDDKLESAYFIPIKKINDSTSLYKKENIIFMEGKLAKSSLEQDVPPKFRR